MNTSVPRPTLHNQEVAAYGDPSCEPPTTSDSCLVGLGRDVIARHIAAASTRSRALLSVAHTQLQIGDKEGAQSTLDAAVEAVAQIEHDDQRASEIARVAAGFARAGSSAKAEELPGLVSAPYGRALVRIAIAQALGETQADQRSISSAFERAVDEARRDKSKWGDRALRLVVTSLTRVGRRTEAASLARSLPDGVPIAMALETLRHGANLDDLVQALNQIADKSARDFAANRAIEILESSGNVIGVQALAERFMPQLAVETRILELARTGKTVPALDLALASGSTFGDPDNPLAKVAQVRLEANDPEGAVAAAQRMTGAAERASVLSDAAAMLAKSGKPDRARALLAKAKPLLNKESELHAYENALLAYFDALLAVDDREQALAIIRRMNPETRIPLLGRVLEASARAGRRAQARKMLADLQQLVSVKSEGSDDRTAVLTGSLLALDDLDGAITVAERAGWAPGAVRRIGEWLGRKGDGKGIRELSQRIARGAPSRITLNTAAAWIGYGAGRSATGDAEGARIGVRQAFAFALREEFAPVPDSDEETLFGLVNDAFELVNVPTPAKGHTIIHLPWHR